MFGLFRPLEEYVDLSILIMGALCLTSLWILRSSSISNSKLELDIYSEVKLSDVTPKKETKNKGKLTTYSIRRIRLF
jgi:hypothetical protein